MSEIGLVKICSGGQTGADQAGLRAARRLGLETGGWAPRNWKTLDGPAPWLADYGLVEHASYNYPPRTAANVRDSDATVRLAYSFSTAGEKCTRRAIEELRKPFFDARVSLGIEDLTEHQDEYAKVYDKLRKFLIDNRVRILNVAGNSELSAPGIGQVVEEFLVKALSGFLKKV